MAIQLLENDRLTEEALADRASRHPMRPSKTRLADSILRRALQMDDDELNRWINEASAQPSTSDN